MLANAKTISRLFFIGWSEPMPSARIIKRCFNGAWSQSQQGFFELFKFVLGDLSARSSESYNPVIPPSTASWILRKAFHHIIPETVWRIGFSGHGASKPWTSPAKSLIFIFSSRAHHRLAYYVIQSHLSSIAQYTDSPCPTYISPIYDVA